ncbi:MAG: hypothetical protein AAF663_08990, partial [Planctomycetota bacterium]
HERPAGREGTEDAGVEVEPLAQQQPNRTAFVRAIPFNEPSRETRRRVAKLNGMARTNAVRLGCC